MNGWILVLWGKPKNKKVRKRGTKETKNQKGKEPENQEN